METNLEPVCTKKTKTVYFVSGKPNNFGPNIKLVEKCGHILCGDILLMPENDDDRVSIYIPFYTCAGQKYTKVYHLRGTGCGSDEKYASGQYNVSGMAPPNDSPFFRWSWPELEEATWFPAWLKSTGKHAWRQLPWCLGIALSWLDEMKQNEGLNEMEAWYFREALSSRSFEIDCRF